MPDITDAKTEAGTGHELRDWIPVQSGSYYVPPMPVPLHVKIEDSSQPSSVWSPHDLLDTRDRLQAMGIEVELPPPLRKADLASPDALPGTPLSETVVQLRRGD